MITILTARGFGHGETIHSWVGRLAARLERWWVAYITWRLEQVAISQLWSMSDSTLKDMGITRSEIPAAVKSDATRIRSFRPLVR